MNEYEPMCVPANKLLPFVYLECGAYVTIYGGNIYFMPEIYTLIVKILDLMWNKYKNVDISFAHSCYTAELKLKLKLN